MPRIVLEDVSKWFAGADAKSVRALDALSIEARDKEMLALVGPSGCGKTTTLRLIAGLEKAASGRILFDEQVVTNLPPAKRDVAMVFQSHALFPHLTAFDNLAVGLKLRHVPDAELISRVHEAAEWLGITDCLNRKPGQLSGGERQRVALGRALVRRPKILLLDEPLSHLDEPLRIQMRDEIRALHTRLNMTTIYVTHDQCEALSLGDRVVVMQGGRRQQCGSPSEIYEKPANTFVAGFIGTPAMNLFQGRIARLEGEFIFVGGDGQAASPFTFSLGDWRKEWCSQQVGEPLTLGIRAENVQVAEDQVHVARGVSAVVQAVEFAGTRTILRVSAGTQGVVACAGANCVIRPGQNVVLSFDLNQARVYDAAGSLIS